MELKLSPKQIRFIKESDAAYNLAHGAVRSGKTLCTLIRWQQFCYGCPDSDLAMIGYSIETIYHNVVRPFTDLFPGYCTWSPGNHTLKFIDKNIRCIGANDQGAIGKIQGSTLSGAYVDEMTLIPTNFLDMLRTRLSKPYSKLFGTMNPDGPLHPIKVNLIDKADGKDVYALHFELDDNPSLANDYKSRLKKFYSGLWYKRYISGEWCMADGAIYDFFDRSMHVRRSPPTAAQFYVAGVDYGSVNPFAMVLVGVNFKHSPKLWVEKEYYWDPKISGRQKTDDEFCDDLERELYGLPVKLIYIDPSAQSLEISLRKRKKIVAHADNDVLNGIRVVSNFISQGDLVICEAAKNLIKEMEGYVWDPKKIKLGEDAPLKQNDHACDALRYAIFTHFGKHLSLSQKDPLDYVREAEQRKYRANPMLYPGFTDSHGWQQFGGQNGLGGSGPQLPGGPFGGPERR